MKGKKKETVGEAFEAGWMRGTYSIEELIALTHCWIEISEHPIVANNREGYCKEIDSEIGLSALSKNTCNFTG